MISDIQQEISSAIKCLGIQNVVILFGCIVFFLVYNNKRIAFYLLASTVFMLAWRSFYFEKSSRYNSAFIVLFFIGLSFFLKGIKGKYKGNRIVLCILPLLLSYQVYTLFHSFKNTYIFDVNDLFSADKINAPNSIVLMNSSEQHRVGNSIKRKYVTDQNIGSALTKFKYWDGDILLCIKSKHTKGNRTTPSSKKVASFITNSKKERFNIVLNKPEGLNNSDIKYQKNLIRNGNAEILESKDAINNKYSYLINEGITYFFDIDIPKADFLLTTWGKIEPDYFPVIYADSRTPIEGKYSLNVLWKENNRNDLFLYNKVPAQEGYLVFSIKRISGSNTIKLKRFDYTQENQTLYHNDDSLFYLNIPDNEVHSFVIHYPSQCFSGIKSIFVLSGNNINFLIDNVAYYTF